MIQNIMVMSSIKRKWNTMEGDEDEPAFGRQILPVANLPNDFDGEPQDGMQYLFTVRRDARQLPSVTRVINPYARPEAQEIDRPRVRHHALPSEEWYLLFIRRFRNLRKQTIGVGGPSLHTGKKLIPGKKERDNWWAFISGRAECEWYHPPKSIRTHKRNKDEVRSKLNETSNLETEDSECSRTGTFNQEVYRIDEDGEIQLSTAYVPTNSLPTPVTTLKPQLRENSDRFSIDSEVNIALSGTPIFDTPQHSTKIMIRREPTPTLLSLFDNRFCFHLLMYFNYWMQQYLEQPHLDARLITDTHGRWIFSLLVRVEENISADDTSLLRTLTRTCLKVIKRKVEEDSSTEGLTSPLTNGSDLLISEAACWMIVASVTGFWKQADLLTEAEHIFSPDRI